MFATLLPTLRLATRVPSGGDDEQQLSTKSPSTPTDGDFPDTHMVFRQAMIHVYSTKFHQSLVPTSKSDLLQPPYTTRLAAAVADAAAPGSPQSVTPPLSSCSDNVAPTPGFQGRFAMPITHGLDSFLHSNSVDKAHPRWTPRRLFSRKSFILDEAVVDDHDNDHDAATLLGEDSPTDEFPAEKERAKASQADINPIGRKIVENLDELLKIQDYTDYNWPFSHLEHDSDSESDPDSATYYSESDQGDSPGLNTPLEASYPSSCCIPTDILIQRLVDTYPDPVSAPGSQKPRAVNEQRLVEVDEGGQEIWITDLAPAPHYPRKRAKIIFKDGDRAALCPLHKCDLPCVPCDPTIPRYVGF